MTGGAFMSLVGCGVQCKLESLPLPHRVQQLSRGMLCGHRKQVPLARTAIFQWQDQLVAFSARLFPRGQLTTDCGGLVFGS